MVELIEFPNGGGIGLQEMNKTNYGLDGIDIERFLQIAPLVPGRALVNSSVERPYKRINLPNQPKGKGESKEELMEKAEEQWESSVSAGSDSIGSGLKQHRSEDRPHAESLSSESLPTGTKPTAEPVRPKKQSRGRSGAPAKKMK